MNRVTNPIRGTLRKAPRSVRWLSLFLIVVLISTFFKPLTVTPAFAQGSDNPHYILRLNRFSISNTMASGTDTDWVYFTIRIGNTTLPTKHARIGDLNNGDYDLNWDLGEQPITPTDQVIMTYQIINHGHGSEEDGIQNDVRIANTIQSTVADIASAIVPPAAPIIKAISAALDVIAGIFNIFFANCDGVVLSDAVTADGQMLNNWTHDMGIHTETRAYTGPETPSGCGSNAQYTVTWSIIRVTPVITCGAADGMWHASDVDIPCTVSSSGGTALEPDTTTSLPTNVPEGTETDGAVTETRSVCDTAGKCATAGPVSGIKIDKKPPTIAIETSNDPVPTWTVVASDAGSGIDPASLVISFDGTNYQPYIAPIPVGDYAGLYARVEDNVGNAAVAIPVHRILDDFNRQDGSVGSSWSGEAAPGHYRIDQQVVDVEKGGLLYWQPTSFGASQEAFITFKQVDQVWSRESLLLKVQGDRPNVANGAVEVRYEGQRHVVRIWTRTRGQNWQHLAEIPATFTDGDQFGARALNDGTIQVYRNGALLGQTNAGSSFAGTGGRIGLRTINAHDTVLDDFGGGSLTP